MNLTMRFCLSFSVLAIGSISNVWAQSAASKDSCPTIDQIQVKPGEYMGKGLLGAASEWTGEDRNADGTEKVEKFIKAYFVKGKNGALPVALCEYALKGGTATEMRLSLPKMELDMKTGKETVIGNKIPVKVAGSKEWKMDADGREVCPSNDPRQCQFLLSDKPH
jgi:hypothetical protein